MGGGSQGGQSGHSIVNQHQQYQFVAMWWSPTSCLLGIASMREAYIYRLRLGFVCWWCWGA
jgi:hypothetical protein